LSYWPAQSRPPLIERTVGDLLRATAGEVPDRTALVAVAEDGTPVRWTYARLLAEAQRVAGTLRERVEEGGRVALWAPNVAQWPIVEYAAALAGLTLVCLNPALRADALARALTVSEASLLVHADHSRSYDMAAVVDDVRGRLRGRLDTLSLSRWDELLAGPPVTGSAGPTPDMPAQLQFTSGTTAAPKAAVLSHRAIVNVARFTMAALGVPRGAVVLSPLPMFHTAGCVVSCLGPLTCAGTLVLLERFAPRLAIDTLRHTGANVLTSVPTVLVALLRELRPDERLPALERVLTGAAPVRSELIRDVEEALGATVFNLYGQTELAPVVSLTRPDDPPAVKAATVGRPLPHLECKIVDPATGATRPVGETGEIWARGYQRMLGYHGDPAATAAAITTDGWLRTGDLGAMAGDGTLRIAGRIKDLIIRGGENIAAGAVEACLAGHPDVADAVVVGVPDDTWGELVGAVLRPRDGVTVDVAALREHCRQRLAPFQIPETWFVVDDFPVTESGKVQKFRLRQLIAEGLLVPVGTGEAVR
jgi:acyl-CoA synthetase (AMP-forming)/AMP-acid ligase II